MKPHLFDTTKAPAIPYSGWTIESHDTSLGKIDLTKLELYLDDVQNDGYVQGHKLREKLKGKPILNACVLDYLFEKQKLIPKSWKEKTKDGWTKYIYFWGTIYRDPDTDRLFVRCLCFIDGSWYRHYFWLGRVWGGNDPAALGKFGTKKLSPKSDPLGLEKRVKELEGDMAKLKKVIKIN